MRQTSRLLPSHQHQHQHTVFVFFAFEFSQIHFSTSCFALSLYFIDYKCAIPRIEEI